MWPIALKEAAYWLNRLSIRSDGWRCEATFFNLDKDLIDPTMFHVFGSPCFALHSRLQLWIAGLPKWDPWSRLGIYVGHSPSHAGSVVLVLNPRTRNVSPQFYVVFDDTFSTVPYMENWSSWEINRKGYWWRLWSSKDIALSKFRGWRHCYAGNKQWYIRNPWWQRSQQRHSNRNPWWRRSQQRCSNKNPWWQRFHQHCSNNKNPWWQRSHQYCSNNAPI